MGMESAQLECLMLLIFFSRAHLYNPGFQKLIIFDVLLPEATPHVINIIIRSYIG